MIKKLKLLLIQINLFSMEKENNLNEILKLKEEHLKQIDKEIKTNIIEKYHLFNNNIKYQMMQKIKDIQNSYGSLERLKDHKEFEKVFFNNSNNDNNEINLNILSQIYENITSLINKKKIPRFNNFEKAIQESKFYYNEIYIIDSKDAIINISNIEEKKIALNNFISFIEKIHEYIDTYLQEINLISEENEKQVKEIITDKMFQVELYKNIYLYFINKILGNNKFTNNNIKNILLFITFNNEEIEKLYNNILSIKYTNYNINQYEEIKRIFNKEFKGNIKENDFNDKELKIELNFQDLEEILKKNNKNDYETYLIQNNGGQNIILKNTNNNIIFHTMNNCTVHSFINFIIGTLIKINNSFKDSIKDDLLRIIIQNFINGVSNLEFNSIFQDGLNFLKKKYFEKLHGNIIKKFAWSNKHLCENILFDNEIEKDVKKILEKGISSENQELINFFGKIYEIICLNFSSKYYFNLKNKEIEIDGFGNRESFVNYLYEFFSGINKAFFELINTQSQNKINYSLFGNLMIASIDLNGNMLHAENLISLNSKEFQEYEKLLERFNEKYIDMKNATPKTFYSGKKIALEYLNDL